MVYLISEISRLKEELALEKVKHSRTGKGKTRKSTVTDTEVLELRKLGSTVLAISQATAISTSTINRILKRNRSHT